MAKHSDGAPEPFEVEVEEDIHQELAERYDGRPFALGRSVGVGKHPLPGTMGGYLLLTEKEVKRTYGLTNNHVVNVLKSTNQQGETPF